MRLLTLLVCLLFILPGTALSFPFTKLEDRVNKNSDVKKYLLDLYNNYQLEQDEHLLSIERLMSIIGMSRENGDVIDIITRHYAIEIQVTESLLQESLYNSRLIKEYKKAYQLTLIKEVQAYKWTNAINEFKGLAKLIFSFMSDEEQNLYRLDFNKSIVALDSAHSQIKNNVLSTHPGLSTINIQFIQDNYSGIGTTIAVFDVFEDELLDIQRKQFRKSKIAATKKFGNPVSLSHGNAVIDIILSIAPEATILPISSDVDNYNNALQYLLKRHDITIINMSRAFLEKHGDLDPNFKNLMIALSSQTIITKSLGNCGTDLYGNLSPLRKRLGLGKVGAISCYDTKLIKQFLTDSLASEKQQNILYAINVNPYAEDTALVATVPGDFLLAQLHSLAVPAEGVYTSITNNFESGSSFAAPQLAAVSALLYQASTKYYPYKGKKFHLYQTSNAIKNGANFKIGNNNEFGLGLLDGEEAIKLLKSNSKL